MMGKLLLVEHLEKNFPIKTGWGQSKKSVSAVNDVSLYIEKGETFGMVGESGCGKSTFGRCVLHLYEPSAGKVIFDGAEVNMRNIDTYRKRMQIVFQDPYSSLDPRMTVGDIVGEPLVAQKLPLSRKERYDIVVDQLRFVGMNTEHMNRYPHEFSGGQRQRISIARALTIKPEFIVCDEPVSALDVSIQAQVINMLIELQQKLGLTYLFIAHDLAVVRHISNRIGVMYLGNLVETCPAKELYSNPFHPYTQILLSAIPIPDPKISRSKKRIILEGDVPSPLSPPSGCRFRTRCPYAREICSEQTPGNREVTPGHFCACHKVECGW
ncbi:MAG: ATP-binding cassette domain-containing protein [Firmicutes bacterium]|nr:ATP-binding cassette domain-containing protein [Bacillota bacterium]